jgi:hypothetical protein
LGGLFCAQTDFDLVFVTGTGQMKPEQLEIARLKRELSL